MTSKNSFWANRAENMKRRMTICIFALLGQLLVYPTVLIMYYSRIQARFGSGEYASELIFKNQMQQATNDALCFSVYPVFMACVFAVLIAMQGFSFLYNRRKEDMYYSVPVSMKKRFRIIYGNGLLIYFVTSFASLLLSLLIALFQGAIIPRIFGRAMISYLFTGGFFFAVYSMVIVAVMMTGNALFSILGSVCLMFYVAVWKELILSSYKFGFFERATGSLGSKTETILSNYSSYLSMVLNGPNQVSSIRNLGEVLKILMPYVVVWVVLGAVMTYVGFKLFMKRPAEAAGKAVVFTSSRPILKILLLIPLSLLAGYFAYDLTEKNVILMAATIAITALLVGFVLEAIFEEDIRSFYCHLTPTIVAMVMALAILGIYRFDVFHFDSYVPKPEQIESFLVYDPQYLSSNDHWRIENGTRKWISDGEFLREHMFLTDTEAICALANKTLSVKPDDLENCHEVSVLYRLKDGREIARVVYIDFADELSWSFIDRVYSTPEYIEGNYQLAHMEELQEDSLRTVTYTNGFSSQNLAISSPQELSDAWIKDMKGLKISSVLNGKQPIAQLELSFRSYAWLSFYIYDGFDNTIGVLQKLGVDTDRKLTVDDVQAIKVTNYHEDLLTDLNLYSSDSGLGAEAKPVEYFYDDVVSEAEYEDPALLQEILEAATADGLRDGLSDHKIDYDYEITVLLKGGENISFESGQTYYFRFFKGRVPDFVQRDTKASQEIIDAVNALKGEQ